MGPTFTFTSTLWTPETMPAYVFVSVPVEHSEVIRDTTSIFPESATGRFLLPVKKAIRQAEDLEVGDPATITIELVL